MRNPATTPTRLRGTFEVRSWEEHAYLERAGQPKLTHVTGSQRFSGDRPDGSARFVGIQHIDGSVGGRRGTLVIESVGDHDGAASRGEWTVVRGAGTGDLEGATGRGRFTAPGGRIVEYELELD